MASADLGAKPDAGSQSPLVEVTGFGSIPATCGCCRSFPTACKRRPRWSWCCMAAARPPPVTISARLVDAGEALRLCLVDAGAAASNNAQGCFNWFNPEDITRDHGEARSIRQMIARMVRDHGIDQHRIFVTGLSAGGAMTSVMLAAYPEVFAAGAVIAGLPYGVASNVREALERHVAIAGSARPASSASSCATPQAIAGRGRKCRCGTAAPTAPSIPPTPMKSSSNGSTCMICRRLRCRKA